MAANESIRLRRILICSAMMTVMTIVYLCSKDTGQWFIQAEFPYLKDEYEYDVRRTLSLQALDRLDTYMNYTDFEDFLSLVNITTSMVSIRNNKSDVRIGDDITIDIVLYNGRGLRATRGGDMLRVWLREHSLKASVSGYVIDHDNGSYTGVVKAMWAGNPELMFSIGNTKEHVGIYMNMVHKYGLTTFLRAGFKKQNVTESSLCSVVPNIPNVTDYCNFTAQNYNFSFFCGKPKKLGCEDWAVYEHTSTHPWNAKQKILFLNYKYFKKSVGKLTILADSGAAGESNVSCHNVSSTITWQTTNPTGYLYNGNWRSLICKSTLSWKYDSYAKCLEDRPVLITGDSTTRNWYSPLTALLKLRVFVGRHEIKDKAWQKFAEAENKKKSLSTFWSPHEIPFFSYEQDKRNFRTVASRIDDLPGNKSAVVLLHWFGHMARTTPKHYRKHITSAKHAILRLLKRSPRSSILIKGPHSFTYTNFLEPLDYIGRIYGQILYEEFKDLQDKVYYIDQWDATVGNENLDIHPHHSFDLVMTNFVFSFICK
ncbi:NXPE family member 3-like [Mizuhopecten yessoensis]|uniref:NXPE family member 3 n=1 Tax=Mizuhopecten yessoensis TaxID=6573 RepID=A0A210PYB8_MIZYE|nr:NXPE family member 3-like [Mizuhopecten yessoensis]OWF41474.1 NXPE family member 3 [Mizuhopecten yessoensis]